MPLIPTSSCLRFCFGSLWLHHCRYRNFTAVNASPHRCYHPVQIATSSPSQPFFHFQALGTTSRMPARVPHKLLYNPILKTSKHRLVPLTNACLYNLHFFGGTIKRRNAINPRRLSVYRPCHKNPSLGSI